MIVLKRWFWNKKENTQDFQYLEFTRNMFGHFRFHTVHIVNCTIQFSQGPKFNAGHNHKPV